MLPPFNQHAFFFFQKSSWNQQKISLVSIAAMSKNQKPSFLSPFLTFTGCFFSPKNKSEEAIINNNTSTQQWQLQQTTSVECDKSNSQNTSNGRRYPCVEQVVKKRKKLK